MLDARQFSSLILVGRLSFCLTMPNTVLTPCCRLMRGKIGVEEKTNKEMEMIRSKKKSKFFVTNNIFMKKRALNNKIWSLVGGGGGLLGGGGGGGGRPSNPPRTRIFSQEKEI